MVINGLWRLGKDQLANESETLLDVLCVSTIGESFRFGFYARFMINITSLSGEILHLPKGFILNSILSPSRGVALIDCSQLIPTLIDASYIPSNERLPECDKYAYIVRAVNENNTLAMAMCNI